MMARTACEMLGNSIRPDDERSVFKGNRRTDTAGTSLMLKMPISWSSVRPGGVLKKCKIYRDYKRNIILYNGLIWNMFGVLTLLGGWMRFLLAWAGDRKRLFLEPVNSLKLGVWSGSKNGLITSDRKFCFENAICILPPVPTGMLFKCCTQRSTATESPIWTMAVPSFVFKNLICKRQAAIVMLMGYLRNPVKPDLISS